MAYLPLWLHTGQSFRLMCCCFDWDLAPWQRLRLWKPTSFCADRELCCVTRPLRAHQWDAAVRKKCQNSATSTPEIKGADWWNSIPHQRPTQVCSELKVHPAARLLSLCWLIFGHLGEDLLHEECLKVQQLCSSGNKTVIPLTLIWPRKADSFQYLKSIHLFSPLCGLSEEATGPGGNRWPLSSQRHSPAPPGDPNAFPGGIYGSSS